MASQVGICNLALTKLGAAHITSIDDNTKSARTLKALYDSLLEAELAAHPWTFATTRVLLPASATPPAYGWGASYPMPVDFLKLVEVGDHWVFYSNACGAPWFTLEGNAVLTNIGSPLQVRYVRKVTSSGTYPALFTQAFAGRLAAEACEAITQNLDKRQGAWNERKQAVTEAKRSNDIALPPQPNQPNSWERAMYGFEG